MNFRLFLGALVILGYSSLNAVTVKVQEVLVDEQEDYLLLIPATDLRNTIKKIQSQIEDGGYELGNDGVEDFLNKYNLAIVVDKDGNFFVLDKVSYDTVVAWDVFGHIVPGESDLSSALIKVYSYLSSEDLETMLVNGLGNIQWNDNLGTVVSTMLGGNNNNPGDVFMPLGDFIGSWLQTGAQ